MQNYLSNLTIYLQIFILFYKVLKTLSYFFHIIGVLGCKFLINFIKKNVKLLENIFKNLIFKIFCCINNLFFK